MNVISKGSLVVGVAVMSSVMALSANAAGEGAWDYTTLTSSVDYSGVKTGCLAAFAAMVVVVAGIWGGKRIMRIFG